MSQILDTLPGSPLSVREVTRSARSMWDVPEADGAPPLADFRASQMNLVLHFGAATAPAEAAGVFERALAFAQVYPCRILVLVEECLAPGSIERFEGKLFSQCYLGRNLRDRCCCEALMLAYPQGLTALVESQVSLWLEADLPVYYWLHRIEAETVQARFGTLLKQARRILYDGAVSGSVYDSLPEAALARLHNLAFARTLRLRQTLGQSLSAVDPVDLVEGLRGVEVMAREDCACEGAILLDWLRTALQACARRAGTELDAGFDLAPLEEIDGHSLAMNWRYRNQRKLLLWDYQARSGVGRLSADFGRLKLRQPMHLEPLDDAMLLAEALFFG
jgi:hypothetical protein